MPGTITGALALGDAIGTTYATAATVIAVASSIPHASTTFAATLCLRLGLRFTIQFGQLVAAGGSGVGCGSAAYLMPSELLVAMRFESRGPAL